MTPLPPLPPQQKTPTTIVTQALGSAVAALPASLVRGLANIVTAAHKEAALIAGALATTGVVPGGHLAGATLVGYALLARLVEAFE